MPSAPPAVFQPESGNTVLILTGDLSKAAFPITSDPIPEIEPINGKRRWTYSTTPQTSSVEWAAGRWSIFIQTEDYTAIWESTEDVPTPDLVQAWTATDGEFGTPGFILERGPSDMPVSVFIPSGSGSSPQLPPAVFVP